MPINYNTVEHRTQSSDQVSCGSTEGVILPLKDRGEVDHGWGMNSLEKEKMQYSDERTVVGLSRSFPFQLVISLRLQSAGSHVIDVLTFDAFSYPADLVKDST